jgi:hypothetical protein
MDVDKTPKIIKKNPKEMGIDLGYELEPIENESGRRTFETEKGVFHAIATDPHGHFHFIAAKGKTPDKLKGIYTSVRECERAIAHYVGS